MEFILTGVAVIAKEFERLGVVSEVLPSDEVLPKELECGALIASHSVR